MSEFNRRLIHRFTSMLPAGNAVEQINAIVDRHDAELYLQALEHDVFYHLIKEAGWDQGIDLIPYASPEQIQGFIDLDVWRRDQFIPARLDRWLDVIVNDTTDERFKRVMRDMDPEIMVIYLKAHMQVFEPDEEGRVPDDAPEMATLSPDGMHVIEYPEDEDRNALVRALLHRLYELDRVLAWTMLEGIRWELQSEMEEYALRWRTSRLEELGFVSRVEALQVYRPLDSVKLREKLTREDGLLNAPRVHVARQTLDLPATLESELTEDFFFVRMLATIEDADLFHEKSFELSSLMNKILIADGVEPGELHSGRQVMRRTLGYLSLGLEFLSRADEQVAGRFVARVPFRDVFRVGISLLQQLQRQSRGLSHRPALTIIDALEYSLLNAEDAALMEGLSRQRPTYGINETTFDLFDSQAQLDAAALRLGQLAFKQLWLFAMQRLTLTDLGELAARTDLLGEPYDVTLDSLFNTWIARAIINDEPGYEPLSRDELAALLPKLSAKPWRKADSVRAHFAVMLAQHASALPEGTDALLIKWIERALDTLEEELGHGLHAAEPGQEIVLGGVLLLKRLQA